MENRIELEQKVVEVLDTIALKLGVGVDHFWPILVEQQYVEAMRGPSFFIVGVLILIATYVYGNKLKTNITESLPGTAGFIFGSGFLVVGLLSSVTKSIPQIINPEYYALKEIMDLLK